MVNWTGTKPNHPAGHCQFCGYNLRGTPGELADVFRAYAREGISHLQVWVNPLTAAGLERVAAALRILDGA